MSLSNVTREINLTAAVPCPRAKTMDDGVKGWVVRRMTKIARTTAARGILTRESLLRRIRSISEIRSSFFLITVLFVQVFV